MQRGDNVKDAVIWFQCSCDVLCEDVEYSAGAKVLAQNQCSAIQRAGTSFRGFAQRRNHVRFDLWLNSKVVDQVLHLRREILRGGLIRQLRRLRILLQKRKPIVRASRLRKLSRVKTQIKIENRSGMNSPRCSNMAGTSIARLPVACIGRASTIFFNSPC